MVALSAVYHSYLPFSSRKLASTVCLGIRGKAALKKVNVGWVGLCYKGSQNLKSFSNTLQTIDKISILCYSGVTVSNLI
jgi:hypothetical protein